MLFVIISFEEKLNFRKRKKKTEQNLSDLKLTKKKTKDKALCSVFIKRKDIVHTWLSYVSKLVTLRRSGARVVRLRELVLRK